MIPFKIINMMGSAWAEISANFVKVLNQSLKILEDDNKISIKNSVCFLTKHI